MGIPQSKIMVESVVKAITDTVVSTKSIVASAAIPCKHAVDQAQLDQICDTFTYVAHLGVGFGGLVVGASVFKAYLKYKNNPQCTFCKRVGCIGTCLLKKCSLCIPGNCNGACRQPPSGGNFDRFPVKLPDAVPVPVDTTLLEIILENLVKDFLKVIGITLILIFISIIIFYILDVPTIWADIQNIPVLVKISDEFEYTTTIKDVVIFFYIIIRDGELDGTITFN